MLTKWSLLEVKYGSLTTSLCFHFFFSHIAVILSTNKNPSFVKPYKFLINLRQTKGRRAPWTTPRLNNKFCDFVNSFFYFCYKTLDVYCPKPHSSHSFCLSLPQIWFSKIPIILNTMDFLHPAYILANNKFRLLHKLGR